MEFKCTSRLNRNAYIFLECIENFCRKFSAAILILNRMLHIGAYYLHELILVQVSINAGCDFGHQNNQQETEELKKWIVKLSLVVHIIVWRKMKTVFKNVLTETSMHCDSFNEPQHPKNAMIMTSVATPTTTSKPM